MKFAFLSGGNTLWLWEHLLNEGHEVGVFHTHPGCEEVGKGYGVELCANLPALIKWGGNSAIYIADITDMPDDKIKICQATDMLRRSGFKVLGGGALAEKLENNREFGQQLAAHCGFKIPEGKQFHTIDQAIDFLNGELDEDWHFKTDEYLGSDITFGANDLEQMVKHLEYIKVKFGNNHPNHSERTIKGPGIMLSGWFNGDSFLHPLQYTLEHKRFLEGDNGPNTGCSLNLCGPMPDELFSKFYFDKIEQVLVKEEAAPGLYDVNLIIAEDGPYFLEWTPRFGYDSEPTIFTQAPEKGMLLATIAVGIAEETPWYGHSYGVRLTVPPYPEEEFKEKASAKEVPVLGPTYASNRFQPYGFKKTEGLEVYVADPYGFIGVAVDTRQDQEVYKSHEEVEEFIHELKVTNLQYRRDGPAMLSTDIAELKRAGVKLT